MSSYPTLKTLTEIHYNSSEIAEHEDFGPIAMDVVEQILDKCQPWLTAVGGAEQAFGKYRVWRGIDERRIRRKPAVMVPIRTNRLPRDSSPETHRGVATHIEEHGLVANRSNSIFVTGDFDVASEFGYDGSPYAVFPVGPFHFTWSPEVADVTIHLDRGNTIESIEYIGDDDSLHRAIDSGHEIMIAATHAIIVREDMFDELRAALKKGKKGEK